MTALRRAKRAVTGRLRRYLDWRFDRLETRLARIGEGVGELTRERSERTRALDRIDLTAHNRNPARPTLGRPISQAVSASQFFEKDFVRWHRVLQPHTDPAVATQQPHRKVWEWVYILRVAEIANVLGAGRSAAGFGVGGEPIPTVLASLGMHVVATDRDPALSSEWVASGQHMGGLDTFANPAIDTRFVDMNDPLGDLGTFHLVWSSGAMEHLGSPQAGFDFLLRSLELLEPGGVAVHTTELDLVPHPETRDYGNLAAYQPEDLDRLVDMVRARGFVVESNWTVAMDTARDRWISFSTDDSDQPAHLKLVVAESVLTSVGIAARRPSA